MALLELARLETTVVLCVEVGSGVTLITPIHGPRKGLAHYTLNLRIVDLLIDILRKVIYIKRLRL